jgi:hypothetical protein
MESDVGGQPLFERGVDSVLIPYAKAQAAQGFIFNLETYGKRFGLSEEQVDYIRRKLLPTPEDTLKRSATPLLDGREELVVDSTYTQAGRRRTAVNDMIHALQMRSAESGVVTPGDYSPEALHIVAEVIADEIEGHIDRGFP